jgi:protein-S-isoprenylcysteine O-methyltransferase Ste14
MQREPAMHGVRQLLAVLLLPFMAVIVAPLWWLGGWLAISQRGVGAWGPLALWLGVAIFAMGLALFAWCVVLFGRVGRGTLAPWDPTQHLVATGPYQYVRNPMITGAAAMLLGETLVIGSRSIGLWLVTFTLINHVYFVLSEEPGLRSRFGEEYTRYCETVPRWIPRPRRRRVTAGS